MCGSLPTLRKFFKHFAPKLMGSSSGGAASNSAKYGMPTYGAGAKERHTALSSSRMRRRDYENFDDNEMAIFETRGRDSKEKADAVANEISIEAGSDRVHADNSSDKAILQTKTFDVRYD